MENAPDPTASDRESLEADAALWRRDLRLASVNAAVWAIGNGLVSTTLVTYLALEFGARGVAVSLILAAPRLAGVFRLLAPPLLARLRGRKAICIAAFVLSAVALFAMLALVTPGQLSTTSASVSVLIVGWCVYHLLEYTGVVLLWSWLGDLMPPRVRGLLIGRRERWLVAGRVVGIGASLALAICWRWIDPAQPRWVPLMYSAAIGALFLLLASVPLARMRRADATPSATPRATWRTIRQCLNDRTYCRLLAYSSFLSLANGVTAAAQSLYPQRVLGFRYEHTVALQAMMHTGQSVIAAPVGGLIDRVGAKRVLFATQLIVAAGPLFFWMATTAAPWWIVAAYVAWIAYAGVNIGLDHEKLAVSPPDNNAPAIAAYHTISDLANAASVILGGFAFDALLPGDATALALYGPLFLAGWAARTLAAGLVLRLIDQPDA